MVKKEIEMRGEQENGYSLYECVSYRMVNVHISGLLYTVEESHITSTTDVEYLCSRAWIVYRRPILAMAEQVPMDTQRSS